MQASRSSVSLTLLLCARSVAFSLLSAGVYRGDRTLKEVLAIGVDEIVKAAYEGLEEVHLMAFLDKERDLLVELLADRSTS